MSDDNRILLQKRRGLCLKLAEALAKHYKVREGSDYLGHGTWDTDEAAQILDMELPMTYAEADAEMAELAALVPRPPGPSLPEQLRQALGVGKEEGIKQLLRAALDAARERDQLREAMRPFAVAADCLRDGVLDVELLASGDEFDDCPTTLTAGALRRAKEEYRRE